ncbi:MAG: NADH-quinone oxidoreductase subunit NuoF [bacterium]
MPKLTKNFPDKYIENNEQDFIKVGMSSCGIAAGADEIYEALLNKVKEENLPIEIKKCGCLGMCYAEPIIEVKTGNTPSVKYRNLDVEKSLNILENTVLNKEYDKNLLIKENGKQKKVVLQHCGIIDPENIEDYLSIKGYQSLRKVLFELGADKTLEEVKKSGLRGRGGAGYPTWQKWTVAKEIKTAENKFIICNGDEGDPGAYMDRSMLEGDPHSVIEGLMIAGYTIGASKGIFYIRAEYPLAVERVQKALDQCYEYGLLGENILESGFKFDVEIRLGAGAFVCGEETALIASIEGKRGYPRPRPPFPATQGLWDMPTIINNVETLSNLPYLISNGGGFFAQIGTEKSKGTKVFALTGKVKKPGLAEVPMGTTLRDIIYAIGGGISKDKEFKAVQTGGPSGGLIPKELLDTEVSYESLVELGSIMGSGGMIIMDEDDCVVDIAKFFIEFSVDESCGKCAPCRIGSTQLLKILERISDGKGKLEDLDKLKKISIAMQKASLCGLGQTAPKPVLSTLRYFEEEYIEHITAKKCRAGQCVALKKYSVDQHHCVKCGACFKECPVSAIKGNRQEGYEVISEKCIKCGKCYDACKFDAIKRN